MFFLQLKKIGLSNSFFLWSYFFLRREATFFVRLLSWSFTTVRAIIANCFFFFFMFYSNFVLKFCPCPLRIQNGGFLSIVLRALQNLLSLKSQVQYANIIKGKQNQAKNVYLIKITNSLYFDSSVLV